MEESRREEKEGMVEIKQGELGGKFLLLVENVVIGKF